MTLGAVDTDPKYDVATDSCVYIGENDQQLGMSSILAEGKS